MVVNLDQTLIKLAPWSKNSITKADSNSISVGEVHNKHIITETFAITLSGEFIPTQLKYRSWNSESLPRVEFPQSFSLSVNPKHYSNEKESIKFFNEIAIPYLKSERKQLKKSGRYWLMMMDMFKHGLLHFYGRVYCLFKEKLVGQIFLLWSLL